MQRRKRRIIEYLVLVPKQMPSSLAIPYLAILISGAYSMLNIPLDFLNDGHQWSYSSSASYHYSQDIQKRQLFRIIDFLNVIFVFIAIYRIAFVRSMALILLSISFGVQIILLLRIHSPIATIPIGIIVTFLLHKHLRSNVEINNFLSNHRPKI